jgi:hypothetical protein
LNLFTGVILRSGVFAASRRMVFGSVIAAILRDAREGALLRMTSQIVSGNEAIRLA